MVSVGFAADSWFPGEAASITRGGAGYGRPAAARSSAAGIATTKLRSA